MNRVGFCQLMIIESIEALNSNGNLHTLTEWNTGEQRTALCSSSCGHGFCLGIIANVQGWATTAKPTRAERLPDDGFVRECRRSSKPQLRIESSFATDWSSPPADDVG